MDYWVATEYDGDTPDGLLKFEVPASKCGCI
jgi:AraC family transcriptional regulator